MFFIILYICLTWHIYLHSFYLFSPLKLIKIHTLANEDSNDETVSSDEEFLPDSDTDSDDDSDTEKPKKKAKTSVTSKENEEEPIPPIQNHLVIQATKLKFCFVCGKACTKIARHLKLHRKDNIEIVTAFKLRVRSKQRSHILEY